MSAVEANAPLRVPNRPAPLRPTPHDADIVDLPGFVGAERGPTAVQWTIAGAVVAAILAPAVLWFGTTLLVAHHLGVALYLVVACLRLAAAAAALPTVRHASEPEVRADLLPSYTVLCPLYGEAGMVDQLVEACAALDYPTDRLQVLFVLEADDGPTAAALAARALPPHMQALLVPPGAPKTKPRACNVALSAATGELLVVYDAEDVPEPGQLREAAASFARDGQELGCLQAPLRVTQADGLIERQFALEYAAQFEVILPALAQVGLPFPLGGTSNHFRTAQLRGALGGWDAFNMTEDAGLGFCLPAAGLRSAMLARHTSETPPDGLRCWLPQRVRWLKGYLQTYGVHTRAPFSGGWRGFIALHLTLGLSIVSAALHGPLLLLTLGSIGWWIGPGAMPAYFAVDLLVLAGGWGAAAVCTVVGARRAGLRPRCIDMVLLPLYWSLLSVAFVLAVGQLVRRPFHWNKTDHRPRRPEPLDPVSLRT